MGSGVTAKSALFIEKLVASHRNTEFYLYHDGTSMTGLELDIEKAPMTDEEMADETESEGGQRDRCEGGPYVEDSEEDSSDNGEEDDVGGVTVRANRRRARREGEQRILVMLKPK